LFCLLGLCQSLSLPEYHNHFIKWNSHSFDRDNITKRATGKTITDLFMIDIDFNNNGGCKSKETDLTNWLAEVNVTLQQQRRSDPGRRNRKPQALNSVVGDHL
jgi:hypothetical protein